MDVLPWNDTDTLDRNCKNTFQGLSGWIQGRAQAHAAFQISEMLNNIQKAESLMPSYPVKRDVAVLMNAKSYAQLMLRQYPEAEHSASISISLWHETGNPAYRLQDAARNAGRAMTPGTGARPASQ